MKRSFPWIVAIAGALLVALSAFRPEPGGERHWREFGRLPVILNGRIKPLDTVARTSLLVIHDKQTLRLDDGERLSAIEWLAEVLFAPARADQRKVFTIHNPEVVGLLGQRQADEKHFSFAELRPHFRAITEAYQLAEPVEAKLRTQFQHHIIDLYHRLILFQNLKNTLQPEDASDFAQEVAHYQSLIGPGVEALKRREAGQSYDEAAFNEFLRFASRYRELDQMGHFLAIPLTEPDRAELRTEWDKMGLSLAKASATGQLHPVAAGYVKLGDAYRSGDVKRFNDALAEITQWITARYAPEMAKVERETFFNRYQPFYKAMVIWVAALVLACISWVFPPGGLIGRTALALGWLAFLVHTSGLVFRVYLQNYPPVTNLYSAAVVVGWGAALIGLIVELFYRNAIGTAAAAVVAFCTLLVAHHLSLGGDTMEMMQAVLDSNFWLSVHVPTIVLGYSAMFAAGAVGLLYVFLGVLTPWLTPLRHRNLGRVAYGIICFATLLSFTGTVLGGIWADQSWGRFWGWDPKENGAALIVIWCAIILHARWAGHIRERGLMIMTIGGNIVTAWSFFGTNLLGIGLHSYGFTSEGAKWLFTFIGSQVLFMILGGIPRRWWRSSPGAASSEHSATATDDGTAAPQEVGAAGR